MNKKSIALLGLLLVFISFSGCGKEKLKQVEYQGSPNNTACQNNYRPEGKLLLAADEKGGVQTLDSFLSSQSDTWEIEKLQLHLERRSAGKNDVLGSANIVYSRDPVTHQFVMATECEDMREYTQNGFGPYPDAEIQFSTDSVLMNSIFNLTFNAPGVVQDLGSSFWSCGGHTSFLSNVAYHAYYGSSQVYLMDSGKVQVLYALDSNLYDYSLRIRQWNFVLVTYKKK